MLRLNIFSKAVILTAFFIWGASSFVAEARGGIVAPLANKVSNIQRACPGTRVISALRRTYVRGTRRISLHASGKAVDVRGRYGCIYSQLKGWPGGYSIDASRVHHIHISYDPWGRREWGFRFRHGGGGYRKPRYQRSYYARRHYRIASRW